MQTIGTLVVIATAIVLAASVRTVREDSLPGCFLSMGDWGASNMHVASMATYMNAVVSHPDQFGCANVSFAFALGDNFYPSGVVSIDDDQWTTTFVNQFRRSSSALQQLPFYAVVGDHDYNQLNPQMQPNASRAAAQVDYHYNVDPLWILPDTNYTFKATFGTTTVLFVVLDTEALYTCLHLEAAWCFKDGQLDWLDAQLSLADNDPSIDAAVVVGHHAVVCPLGGHYDPKIDDVLVPIGRQHRVSLFLTAHSHFIAWSSESDLSSGNYTEGEMWYIINGAGRGAGAYQCWWNGLNFRVAKPENKRCFPYSLNDAGAFMLHRVYPDMFEHCVLDALNGTVMACQTASFRKATP